MADDHAPASMRVERTFAFVDLVAFTTWTDNEGDDRAVEVLALFRTTVRAVSAARGVRVAKWMGDGAMLVGVEREPLIAAVIDIERGIAESGCPLDLRGGLTVGPVILFEGDDYIGHAVNLASRLCDEAGPREILTPIAALEGLEIDATTESAGVRKVRGVEEPVELVRLLAVN